MVELGAGAGATAGRPHLLTVGWLGGVPGVLVDDCGSVHLPGPGTEGGGAAGVGAAEDNDHFPNSLGFHARQYRAH